MLELGNEKGAGAWERKEDYHPALSGYSYTGGEISPRPFGAPLHGRGMTTPPLRGTPPQEGN